VLTYIVHGDDSLEVLTLHSQVEGAGAGSALLAAAAALARRRGCRRLWLVTTNDNLHALGFYQRRGLRLRAVHAGAVDRDRALKPEIAAVNPDNRIPLHDLLELELPL
jgi:ribosomal protein S18 acetylase RimI-like enzyme